MFQSLITSNTDPDMYEMYVDANTRIQVSYTPHTYRLIPRACLTYVTGFGHNGSTTLSPSIAIRCSHSR